MTDARVPQQSKNWFVCRIFSAYRPTTFWAAVKSHNRTAPERRDTMANSRIGRIHEEIQRELSALLRTVKDPRLQGGMLTVTHVDTTSDLRWCKVYVSALDKSRE